MLHWGHEGEHFSTSTLPPVFQVQEVAQAVLRKIQTSLAFLHFFLELGQQSRRSLPGEANHGRRKEHDLLIKVFSHVTWHFVFHDLVPRMPSTTKGPLGASSLHCCPLTAPCSEISDMSRASNPVALRGRVIKTYAPTHPRETSAHASLEELKSRSGAMPSVCVPVKRIKMRRAPP